MVSDESVYAAPGNAEWVSGACVAASAARARRAERPRRGLLPLLRGRRPCRRLWDAGYEVRYEPEAVCVHTGGASAPRAELPPRLARSRILYARKARGSARRGGDANARWRSAPQPTSSSLEAARPNGAATARALRTALSIDASGERHVRNLRSHPGFGEPRSVVTPEVLDWMTDTMTRRGPDDPWDVLRAPAWRSGFGG